jgi:uncharacterized protein (DUF2164 family)
MIVEFPKQARAEAVNSIKKYFEENMPEPIGDLAAGLLLDFFVEDIGPVIYNRGVADAQARMERYLSDLGGELFAEEFQYWQRLAAKRKKVTRTS